MIKIKDEYVFSYEQRLPGYSGDLPEHWRATADTADSRAAIDAARDRLDTYIEHQAERYPGVWVRNIAPVQHREVHVTDWETWLDR